MGAEQGTLVSVGACTWRPACSLCARVSPAAHRPPPTNHEAHLLPAVVLAVWRHVGAGAVAGAGRAAPAAARARVLSHHEGSVAAGRSRGRAALGWHARAMGRAQAAGAAARERTSCRRRAAARSRRPTAAACRGTGRQRRLQGLGRRPRAGWGARAGARGCRARRLAPGHGAGWPAAQPPGQEERPRAERRWQRRQRRGAAPRPQLRSRRRVRPAWPWLPLEMWLRI